jgi:anti-sigma B factor antagonist
MSTPLAKMLVMVGEGFACVRIIGRANFASSVDFRTLVGELRQRGCKRFVLDLADCVLMDSTFLGVLAGFGLKLRAGNGDADGHPIELVNPSVRITELLETLGVLHLFKLIQGPLNLPAPCQPVQPTPANPTRAEVTRTCLEAHQTLIEVSPANAARFKDVAQFLAEGSKAAKAE